MAPSPMSELIVEEEALNLTAGSKRPSQGQSEDEGRDVPIKKRKRVNFNLTLNLTTEREQSESPELLVVPSVVSSSTAAGSDLDEQIPTTPGGRLQVEKGEDISWMWSGILSVRGRLQMTSAKFSGFWTPSPPLSVPNPRNLPSSRQKFANPLPPPLY